MLGSDAAVPQKSPHKSLPSEVHPEVKPGTRFHEGRPIVREYGCGRFAVLCPYRHVISNHDLSGGLFGGSWLEAKMSDRTWVERCYGTLAHERKAGA